MRISYDPMPDAALAPVAVVAVPSPVPVDPTAPDLSFLAAEFPLALQSFYATVDHLIAANPVDSPDPKTRLLQAMRQGKAVAAAIGFFLKFKPYPMLAEVRAKEKLFQPAIGPILVVDGATVREVFD